MFSLKIEVKPSQNVLLSEWYSKLRLTTSVLVALCSDEFLGTRSDIFTCRNCGGGDRGRVAIYRPFGEVSLSLSRTVTCMVLKANDRRTSCPMPR
ncbi:uncharacterized protein TNCV_2854841 [Trichonephila clavipes]|nr:uncharacterized protein TNCV_2854841 [Trichonephila clavipes]